MAADDTTVIAIANAPRSYVQPDHLCTFTGLDDIREALHRLYAEGLLVPLSNGLILAPGLILERADAALSMLRTGPIRLLPAHRVAMESARSERCTAAMMPTTLMASAQFKVNEPEPEQGPDRRLPLCGGCLVTVRRQICSRWLLASRELPGSLHSWRTLDIRHCRFAPVESRR